MMQVKPRREYVIVKEIDWGNKPLYFMARRYGYERIGKYQNPKPDADYVATGLSYKQAKQMMKLFTEQ